MHHLIRLIELTYLEPMLFEQYPYLNLKQTEIHHPKPDGETIESNYGFGLCRRLLFGLG